MEELTSHSRLDARAGLNRFTLPEDADVLAPRERREKERLQLADLVGRNLTYLSQLEGLDFKLYQVRPGSLWTAAWVVPLDSCSRRPRLAGGVHTVHSCIQAVLAGCRRVA